MTTTKNSWKSRPPERSPDDRNVRDTDYARTHHARLVRPPVPLLNFMWSFEHTEATKASPERLWKRYADRASWSEWDHGIESITLDGPFAVGTTGTAKPKRGPATKFEVLEVTEGRSFTEVSFLPLARMRFSHKIDPTPTGADITHRVTISGPLAPLFSRVIGKKVAAELPAAMRRLGSVAVQP